MLTTTDFDVIIAGGGPAGSSAAIQLAERGASVLLVEKEKFPRAKLCGEFISPECFAHFDRLGVGDAIIAAGGAKLLETVFYSRRGARVSVPSEWFTGSALFALGLSRSEMDARLLARARDAGAAVLEETNAVGVQIEGDRVCGIELRSNGTSTTVSARMVVDATGRARSLARRIAGGESVRAHEKVKRASLVAFKAHLENASVAPGTCEIFFYPGGYGGLSTVERGLSNLCFIASARIVRECGNDPERVMREVVMLNYRARETLADARAGTPWLSVAIERFGRRDPVPAPGMLAIGDAASFIDPFTGSGILMALECGELAAEVISDWLGSQAEPREFDVLAREYRARYRPMFDRRLRICSLLRTAAFAPGLAGTAIRLANLSGDLRRGLARSTRNRA